MKSFQNRFLTIVHFAWWCGAVVFAVLSMNSCDDKKSTTRPVVHIEYPKENQFISTTDTVDVVIALSHDRPLKSITVALLDENFVALGVENRYSLSSSTQQNITVELIIDKPLWNSGVYYISARATDGEATGVDYVKINLTAIERKIERFIAITKHTLKTDVYVGESMEELQKVKDFSMDLAGAAYNYKQNILGLAGGELGDAVFMTLPEFDEVRVIPGFGNSSIPYFRSLDFYENRFLLTDNQPMLTILNQNAQTTGSFDLTSYFLPRRSFSFGEHVFVDQKGISSNERMLGHYYTTGYLKGNYLIFGDVKRVSEKSEIEAFVWLNADEGARLDILDYNTSSFSEVFTRANEELYDVVEIQKGVFLFSTSQGLYRYTYGSGTTVLNTDIELRRITYDSLYGFIYGYTDATIYKISNFGDFVSSRSFAHSVAHFAIDYNR